ncbi:MAG: esterase-like activity of phytase family protein [Planctomycetota bacterium]
MHSIRRQAAMLLAVLLVSVSRAEPEFLGQGSLPGNMSDFSNLKGKDALGVPSNRLGGMGSAIDYTGKGNTYILASDRGPGDGASDYRCRVHRMEIVVRPGAMEQVSIKLLSTTLLSGPGGVPLTGSKKPGPARFDPEGIRVGPAGRFFISDEYGPVVAEFSPNGELLRKFPLPARFLPEKVAESPMGELPPASNRGRQPNRGMEGLAISADGKTLYGIMQSPLIQDGALDPSGKRVGLLCRMAAIDIRSGSSREFAYRLDKASHGVNEILAAGADSFLMIERDGLGGNEAKAKKIFLANTTGATDVSGVDSLPGGNIPAEIKPMKKRILIDLLDPRYRLAGPSFPEKIEGLAFGRDLPDGRKLLLVTADNDFVAEVPFRVYAFAVSARDLDFAKP